MIGQNVEDIYELSPLQEGMLYHSVLDPTAGMFTYDYVFELYAEIEVAALERALTRLLARHSILRSSFHYEEIEKPVQVVHRDVKVPVAYHDLRSRPTAEQTELVRSLTGPKALCFDLTEPPLMRVAVVQTADQVIQLVLVFHHVIVDGWSVPILINELAAFYASELGGEDVLLPPARPFRDFIDWLQNRDASEDEAFWRSELDGFSSITELAIRQSCPEGRGREGDFRSFGVALSPAATDELEQFARQNQLTVNSLTQAAWGLLLGRYSGRDDVLFGTSANGRVPELEGVDTMVGVFINTNPFRITARPRQPLLPWLQHVHNRLLAMRKHEHTPLVQVRQWTEVPPGGPLFESMLVFENYPTRGLADPGQQGGGAIISLGGGGKRLGYPIVVTAVHNTALYLEVTYDARRFPGHELDDMSAQLKCMLENMPAYAERPVWALPMLAEPELTRRQSWSLGPRIPAAPKTVIDGFEERAQSFPNEVAVIAGATKLTYGDLNRQANQLAHRLLAHGVGPETRVGICLERSPLIPVGLLGILKSGAAYVPLDPDYPLARLSAMVEAAEVECIVTQRSLAERLPAAADRLVFIEPEDAKDVPREAAECGDPVRNLEPDNLAYIIFTSGSTGTPNPVLVTHLSLAHYADHAMDEFELTAADRVLQFASISFDTAAEEIFPSLLRGSTLAIRTTVMLASVPEFLDACEKSQVTVLDLPTSYWHELTAELSRGQLQLPEGIRLVIIGGERARPQSLELWRQSVSHKVRLLNTYGPTEATIVATSHELTAGADPSSEGGHDLVDEIPIGRPIADARAYVLDRFLCPVPVGVAGELYLGGVGITRGYFQRPARSAERYIPDPWSPEPGQRLYRTGDLCRWLPDGRLAYCGRMDQQVKLRGYRIELEEVESVLHEDSAIREAVVVLRDEPPRGPCLVAYYTVEPGVESEENQLRSWLQTQLPDHAVPGAFIRLDEMPRNPSGKIDRQRLPSPDDVRMPVQPAYVAPRTEVEEEVAAIFAEALQLERVSLDANFFDLGGHSLLAIRVWSQLNETFEIELPLRSVVESGTAEALALAVEEAVLHEIEALDEEDVEALRESEV